MVALFIAVAVFVLLLRTKINPAWPILAAGAAGVALHWAGIFKG